MGCAEARLLIPGLAHARQGLIERPSAPPCHGCHACRHEERQGKVAM